MDGATLPRGSPDARAIGLLAGVTASPRRPVIPPRCYSEDMKYPVALVRTDEGYSVSCPGLPGCWSQGATEEEALANIRDAIREYLEVAKQLAGEQNLREVDIPA